MSIDRFILKDENGNVLVEKSMVEHIKVFFDDMKPERGKHFTVKSEVTGFELVVSVDTTAEEWRAFSDKCLMALD